MKLTECQWRRSNVFIVKFEHISDVLSNVSIVDFEQLNVCCDVIDFEQKPEFSHSI